LLELHEAWTFDDKILLNEVFHPRYVHQIKSGLESGSTAAESTVEEEGRRREMEAEEEDMRRLRRMYGLYMETDGKTINLDDWFGAFCQQTTSAAVVKDAKSAGGGAQKKRKKLASNLDVHEEEEDEGQMERAAFVRALADLAFLGLVSHAGRKKEHVAKSFFG